MGMNTPESGASAETGIKGLDPRLAKATEKAGATALAVLLPLGGLSGCSDPIGNRADVMAVECYTEHTGVSLSNCLSVADDVERFSRPFDGSPVVVIDSILEKADDLPPEGEGVTYGRGKAREDVETTLVTDAIADALNTDWGKRPHHGYVEKLVSLVDMNGVTTRRSLQDWIAGSLLTDEEEQ